ncbi:hypothetical protein [Streptomyces albospinus]|nr:hypothetical protein [Streptomyces albospinus]
MTRTSMKDIDAPSTAESLPGAEVHRASRDDLDALGNAPPRPTA